MVITAVSLTGTLGGWALLTVNDQTVTQAVAAVPPAIVQPVGESPQLALGPVPTLVPRRERTHDRAGLSTQPAAPQSRVAPAAPQQSVPVAPQTPRAQTRSSR
jgi:hypothetical protein